MQRAMSRVIPQLPAVRILNSQAILRKSRKPLYAASKVLNYSSASASTVLTKCWAHGTNKTSALIKKGYRAYSTKTGNGNGSSSGGPDFQPGSGGMDLPFYRKLINAWTQTPTKWYPLPIAVGALLLVAIQYRKKSKRASKEVHVDEDGMEVIQLKGPWQVHVIGALPLRNLSRLWGYVNSLELPVWFRPYGFRFYAFLFGCNLDEIEIEDLREYPSLGAFFYRKLKPGARVPDDAVLVSPADGTVLHFGTITDLHIEQVKGITYSLDALLGVERHDVPVSVIATEAFEHNRDMSIVDDREFANVNGIEYTLDQLIGGSSTPSSPSSSSPSGSGTSTPTSSVPSSPNPNAPPKKFGEQIDASVVEPDRDEQETLDHDKSVAREMGVDADSSSKRPPVKRRSTSGKAVRPGNSLFFTVIYLAPGDYHRFHSPTAWVVEKRRHFVGELYSVSPYMAKRLQNLFVLNERVALLGRWRHGFFSMVPVGATNVGSIKINFDQALRTNVRGRLPPPGTYTEAVYSAASSILNGQPLVPAQEMGGFCLGSTIVLVFEAPNDFEFEIQAGQKVKVGQTLGDISGKLKKD